MITKSYVVYEGFRELAQPSPRRWIGGYEADFKPSNTIRCQKYYLTSMASKTRYSFPIQGVIPLP